MNLVSEPSLLNEGDLPLFCDHSPSVPKLLLSTDDDFREVTRLSAPHRTQLVRCSALRPPTHNFRF